MRSKCVFEYTASDYTCVVLLHDISTGIPNIFFLPHIYLYIYIYIFINFHF